VGSSFLETFASSFLGRSGPRFFVAVTCPSRIFVLVVIYILGLPGFFVAVSCSSETFVLVVIYILGLPRRFFSGAKNAASLSGPRFFDAFPCSTGVFEAYILGLPGPRFFFGAKNAASPSSTLSPSLEGQATNRWGGGRSLRSALTGGPRLFTCACSSRIGVASFLGLPGLRLFCSAGDGGSISSSCVGGFFCSAGDGGSISSSCVGGFFCSAGDGGSISSSCVGGFASSSSPDLKPGPGLGGLQIKTFIALTSRFLLSVGMML